MHGCMCVAILVFQWSEYHPNMEQSVLYWTVSSHLCSGGVGITLCIPKMGHMNALGFHWSL